MRTQRALIYNIKLKDLNYVNRRHFSFFTSSNKFFQVQSNEKKDLQVGIENTTTTGQQQEGTLQGHADNISAQTQEVVSNLSSTTDLVHHAGDLEKYGLPWSFYPTSPVQHIIEAMHVYGGVPWWITIAASTVLIRMLLFPYTRKSLIAGAKHRDHQPELKALMAQMQEATRVHDNASLQIHTRNYNEYLKRHDIPPPLQLFKWILLPIPVFITHYFAIRGMTTNLPSFKIGGDYWFVDLSIPDPLWLPVISGSCVFVGLLIGGYHAPKPAAGQPDFSRILMAISPLFAGLATYVSSQMPAGVTVYFVTGGIYTVIQQYLTHRSPLFRRVVGLPPLTAPPPPLPWTWNRAVVLKAQEQQAKAQGQAQGQAAQGQATPGQAQAQVQQAQAKVEKPKVEKPKVRPIKRK